MRRLALVVLVGAGACFRGAFLAGTACEDDRECAPRYVCIREPATTGGDSGGDMGRCGTPDRSPPDMSSTSGTTGDTETAADAGESTTSP